jgi:hypothetical protein
MNHSAVNQILPTKTCGLLGINTHRVSSSKRRVKDLLLRWEPGRNLRCPILVAVSAVSIRLACVSAAVLACLWGCRNYPPIVPRIGSRDAFLMTKEAPMVVVGVAKSVAIVASCRIFDSSVSPEKSGDEWPLSLKLITLDVENVLKGLPNVHEVSFYRYEWCGNYIRNGTPEVKLIDPGSRGIYFLRSENNYLRAFNDYTYTHLRLWSGFHKTADIQGDSLEERIVWLMMTPGADINGEAFAETLRMQVDYGLEAQQRIFRRMLPLLEHPDSFVRTGACLAIAWNFSGRPSCLSQPYIMRAPSNLSWAIQGAETASRQRERVLRDKFLNDPFDWLRLYGCEELDILSLHEDPLIAQTTDRVA